MAITYVAIASLHGAFEPIAPGIDNSWIWALNHLGSTEYRFGTDVLFTYGPLGYLLAPLNVGAHLLHAAGMWVFSQGALVVAAVYHFRRNRRVLPILLFGVLILGTSSLGMLFEYRTLLTLALLLTFAPSDRPTWRSAAVVAGAFAGILLYTKFTVSIAAVAMIASTAIGWGMRAQPLRREMATWLVSPFLLTAALVGGLTIGGPGAIAAWFGGSLEVSEGFAVAMSVPEPGILVVLGMAGVAAVVSAIVLRWREEGALPIVLLPMAIALLAAVRHGYVRHHGRFLLPVLLAGVAVLALTARTRRSVAIAASAALIVTGTITAATQVRECLCGWDTDALLPARGWDVASKLSDWDATRADLSSRSEVLLTRDVLPAAWVDRILDSGGEVDALPVELAYMPANGLPWRPNPVLQTYAAYTPDLDERVARHFQRGPEWLLVEYADLDMRQPMFTASRMWRAIVSAYEPSEFPPVIRDGREVALLHRRQEFRPISLEEIRRERVRVGEWVDVPDDASRFLYARVRLDTNVAGWLATLLWRVDPVLIELQFDGGASKTHRFIPSTAAGGLLMSPLPRSLGGLLEVLAGGDGPSVRRFRIFGAGVSSFEEEIEVVWQRGTWEP